MDDQRASDAMSQALNYFPPNKFVAACADSNAIDTVREALRSQNIKVDGFDSNGQTALVCACQAGNKAAVRLLLDYDANVSASNRQGQTPHTVTANKEIIQMLDDQLVINRLAPAV